MRFRRPKSSSRCNCWAGWAGSSVAVASAGSTPAPGDGVTGPRCACRMWCRDSFRWRCDCGAGSGRRCMDELSLAIAGLRATVVTQHRDILDVVRDRYKGFLSPGTADWRIEVDVRRAAGQGAHDDVRVSRDAAPGRFVIERADFAGTVALPARRASVTFVDANEYSLDSFLRILYSLALVEALLPNVLFFARDADLTARVLQIAADLIEAVPCFDLSFRLDPGFWEVIDRA